jgi:hypothetical protein
VLRVRAVDVGPGDRARSIDAQRVAVAGSRHVDIRERLGCTVVDEAVEVPAGVSVRAGAVSVFGDRREVGRLRRPGTMDRLEAVGRQRRQRLAHGRAGSDGRYERADVASSNREPTIPARCVTRVAMSDTSSR